nr:baseplate J/gp47 family protein [Chloroflexota bacterium]
MQIIELQGDENITVIRNLLERATDQEVVLFVPRGCEALERNEVNLRVLRRWADNLALRIALVIEDRGTHVMARQAGFILLPSIEKAQKANLHLYERRRRRLEGLPPRPSPVTTLPQPARQVPIRAVRRKDSRVYVGILVSVLSFLTLALFLLFVLPSATVTLTPVSEAVEASMEIVGVAGLKDINYGLAEVPARLVSVEREGSDKIATTDRRDVPDAHAQGTVVFANRTTIPVTITKGTVVRTSSGENVRFYTVADAWLPGELFATVRVGILAAEPGPIGNVPALRINVIEGELAAQADVLNDARTSGGTLRRMSVVASEDQDHLRAKLMKRLQEEAYSELTAALSKSEFIPPDSLSIAILDQEFDHKVGDMADELGMRMKVRVTGLAVDRAHGEKLLLRLLEQRMKPGYCLLDDSATFEQGDLIEATPEKARFSMSAKARMAPAIEAKDVSTAIAGKTIEAAKEYLMHQFKLSSTPHIQLSNSLFQRLPWWAARIRVRISIR